MTAPTPLAFTYTADAGYALRLARAQFRVLRLRKLIPTAALVLLVLALAVLVADPVLAALALALAALNVAVELLTFRAYLRVARRTASEGLTLAVEYLPVVMRTTERGGETFLPYAALKEAHERGRFVALVPRAGSAVLLPAEVCPPDAVAVVRAGILSGLTPAIDEQQFPHRAQPGPDYGRAVSRRALAMLATDATALGLAGSIAVVGAGLSLLLAAPEPAVLAGLVLLAWPITTVLSVRSAFRRQLGSDPLFARFDVDTFTTAHRGTVVRLPYDAFDRMREPPDALELRSAVTRQWHLFPAELFPPEARERFRYAVAASAPDPRPDAASVS